MFVLSIRNEGSHRGYYIASKVSLTNFVNSSVVIDHYADGHRKRHAYCEAQLSERMVLH